MQSKRFVMNTIGSCEESMRSIEFSMARTFDVRDMISLQLSSTSKGNQRKWYYVPEQLYVKQQFFYDGKFWKDYLVEVIAYKISEKMNLHGVSVVPQFECLIKDRGTSTHGVYSTDFTLEGERFVSFNTILKMKEIKFPEFDSVSNKWDFVINVFKEYGLDYTHYLIVMSLLDYLVGNEDRHLSNFGCLQTTNGFKEAPLFDFGLGLFEHDRCYEGVPFRQCLNLMQSKPFASDNQEVIDFLFGRYELRQYLPDKIDLTGVEIPSPKAGSYLLNRCHNLGIKLEGVE